MKIDIAVYRVFRRGIIFKQVCHVYRGNLKSAYYRLHSGRLCHAPNLQLQHAPSLRVSIIEKLEGSVKRILLITSFWVCGFLTLPITPVEANDGRPQGAQSSTRFDFACSKRQLWFEGQDIRLGDSTSCDEKVIYTLKENHREKFAAALSLNQMNNDQPIDDTLGLNEKTINATIRGQVLPSLQLTLQHYEAEAPGTNEPYKLTSFYSTVSNTHLPFNLTLGQERDSTSNLKIGYITQPLGRGENPVNGTLYAGGTSYDREFPYTNVRRTDRKWLGAIQLNLNRIDQSIILGASKETKDGPVSQMLGFHGALSNPTNEWTTLCRVRRSRDSRENMRATEFCLVQISIGNEGLRGRGRYVNFLGVFVPGLGRVTRIVNNNQLDENGSNSNTRPLVDRPKWEFIGTHTLVEITDNAQLEVRSLELYHSNQDREFYGVKSPYSGIVYTGMNNLYADYSAGAPSLRNTDPREEVALAIGGGVGPDTNSWNFEFRIGRNINHNTPVFGLLISKNLK